MITPLNTHSNRPSGPRCGTVPVLGLFFLLLVQILFTPGAGYGAGTSPDDISLATSASEDGPPFDLVIVNGRVIDPETDFDRLGVNVGIRDGIIEAVTEEEIEGRSVIDATGLVVSPGFIDLLSYDPNGYGVWYKLADGVTTNLSMHGAVASDMANWYSFYSKKKLPVNFGGAYLYTVGRREVGLGRYNSASEEQIRLLTEKAKRSLVGGALGISISLEYNPGISEDEVEAMMLLGVDFDVPVLFHARYSDMEEPGTNEDAIKEIVKLAVKTGAKVHIQHINSTGGTFNMEWSLAFIGEARRYGVDITACTYPYTFWATYLNSARFDSGWQSRFKIGYGDLQLAGSSERLTKATYQKYKKEGKIAVAYAMPEEDIIASLKSDFVMIGSDAILERGNNNHPRASGAFARTIGRYVREKGVITLMDALKKMTIMPASRFESVSPAMARKGRLRESYDADITIFDYNTIIDRATVERPDRYSEGIEYVIVGGQVVKDKDGINKRVTPGRAIMSSFGEER